MVRALIASAVLLTAASATADSGATIAVVVTDRSGVTNDMTLQITGALEAALRGDGLEVLPWTDNQSSVSNLDARCRHDSGCIRATGNALGASDLMLVSLSFEGDKVIVELTWADAATGSAIPRPRIELSNMGEAQNQFEGLEELVPKPETPAAQVEAAASDDRFGVSFWASAGLGGAALLTAGALGLYTRTRYRRCESDRDAGQPCGADELDSIDRAALVGDVFLLTSVAALATATVLFVLDAGPSKSPALGIAPDRGGARISLTARF
ncbi:MAG: hypothetical protein KJO07_15345 [Deltaproteobacteria bacterium]|nr:hypothetical protein [Deltaproteobacteria bacterium]